MSACRFFVAVEKLTAERPSNTHTLLLQFLTFLLAHCLPFAVAAASSALQLGEAMSFPVTAQGLIRHPGWAPNRQLLHDNTGEGA
jgi:hypothetical protein